MRGGVISDGLGAGVLARSAGPRGSRFQFKGCEKLRGNELVVDQEAQLSCCVEDEL